MTKLLLAVSPKNMFDDKIKMRHNRKLEKQAKNISFNFSFLSSSISCAETIFPKKKHSKNCLSSAIFIHLMHSIHLYFCNTKKKKEVFASVVSLLKMHKKSMENMSQVYDKS